MQDLFTIFVQELALRLPDIVWALVIIIFGLIIGDIVKRYVIEFFDKIRLNQLTKSLGWEPFFDRFSAKMDFSQFFGILAQIYFFLLFLSISFEVLNLNTINTIAINVIRYYPNIFVASGIFIFAIFVTDLSQKIIVGKADKGIITYSNILGKFIGAGTWILAVLAMLFQLQIVRPLVLTIFIGVVASIALAVGLALGLGAKDTIARILKDIEDRSR